MGSPLDSAVAWDGVHCGRGIAECTSFYPQRWTGKLKDILRRELVVAGKVQMAGEWQNMDEMDCLGFPCLGFGLPALP